MSRMRLEVRDCAYTVWLAVSAEVLAQCSTAWIEVEKISDGCYKLVGSSLIDEIRRPVVTVGAWDETVRVSSYDDYDPPCILWWNDVTMNMLEGEFHAPSEQRLREALQHVAFMGWDPLDV